MITLPLRSLVHGIAALATLAFTGCATPQTTLAGPPPTMPDRYTAIWQRGAFGVTFHAGERHGSDQAPSTYQVIRRATNEARQEIVTPSFFHREMIDNMDDIHLDKQIQILADVDQRQLFMVEDLPNEIGPWTSATLVTAGADGKLTARFFQLPSRQTGPGDQAINYEYPTILSFRAGEVTLKYTGGKPERRKITTLEVLEQPRPSP